MRYSFEQEHDVLEYSEAGSVNGNGVILRHSIRDDEHGDIKRGDVFLNKDELVQLKKLIAHTLTHWTDK